MTTTISTKETTEFLLNADSSPLTITATGGVSVASGYAIDGYVITPLIVANAGTITAGGEGVFLLDGGTVTNTGTIIGTGGPAILLTESGTITNGGSLGGEVGVDIRQGAGLVTNTGVINASQPGVLLYDGGTISNNGTIIGALGIYLADGGTVLNAGTITGGDGRAVQFHGSQSNRLIIDPGAVFNGNIGGGSGLNILELASGTTYGTITNTLASQYAGFNQVTIDSGADWTLTQTIGAGITINNAGTLALAASSFTNAGVIYSNASALLQLTGASIANTGTILTTAGYNIRLRGGGTAANAGSIGGADGIAISGGAGYAGNTGVVNVEGQQITPQGAKAPHTFADFAGIALLDGGTVVNSGTVAATQNIGVALFGGGTVINTGTIISTLDSALGTGVLLGNGGTLLNAGTITGGDGSAVQVLGTQSSRLIIDPGAVFNGTVSGGSGLNILELAYTAAQGTITNTLASQYAGFNQITVDSGAYWTLTQNIGAGITINNAGMLALGPPANVVARIPYGTLTNAGVIYSSGGGGLSVSAVTLANTGTIINNDGDAVYLGAGIISNSGTIASTQADGIYLSFGGTVINSGTIAGAAGIVIQSREIGKGAEPGSHLPPPATIVNSGTITGTGGTAIKFTGPGNARLVIDPGAVFNGTVTGGSGLNTLELAGPSTVYRNGTSYYYGNGVITSTLASQYAGFNQVTIDSGAYWTLTQNIGVGITINNAGALALYGSSLANAGVIANYETSPLAFIGATLANSGSIGGTRGIAVTQGAAYVSNSGTFNFIGPDPSKGLPITSKSFVYDGIDLLQGGTVVNTGTVSATYDDAIVLHVGVVLNTGTVTAIDGTVVNTGTITATDGRAVLLAGGTVVNTGTITATGGEAVRLAGTLINAGTISSSESAAVEFSGTQSNQLVIDPGAVFYGTVTGGGGVNILELANNGYGLIANTLASQYVGFNQVTVDAGADWALAQDIGVGITITNAGALALRPFGGTITNAGVINSVAAGTLTAAAPPILLGGVITMFNTGTILAAQGYGIAVGGGTLVNSGSIGGAGGVEIAGITVVSGFNIQNNTPTIHDDPATLINSGTITGTNGTAVKFTGIDDARLVIDPGAAFYGTVAGVTGLNTLELAGPSTVYRNGTSYYYRNGVIASTLASQYVGFNQITVDAGADWALAQDIGVGITITNAGALALRPFGGTITNAGVINSVAAGTLTVLPSGVITMFNTGTILTMFNTGTILAAQGYGIAVGGGTLVNSGSIGGAGGVEIAGITVVSGFNIKNNTLTIQDDPATLINSGTITGTNGTAVKFTGIDDARLVIDPGAVFNGTVAGVTGLNTLELAAAGANIGTISNIGARYTNFGDVTIDSGAEWQINGSIGAGDTVSNQGALLGASSSLSSGAAANGLTAGGAIVTNGSLISGGDAYGLSGTGGIGVSLTGGSLSNTGNIYGGYAYGREGAGGAGVLLDGGTLVNAGRITGGKLDVQSGNAPGAAGAGLVLAAGTLITSGTITGGIKSSTGTRADAVQFAGGAVLVVESGADFSGQVAASSNADILEVSGTSATELTGIGTQFTGFAQISFAAGAAWTLAGSTLGLASGQTITGFTLGDALDLTGVSAASYAFQTGVLTLTNGGLSEHLDFTGDLTAQNFSITGDGSGGTFIEVTCFLSGTRIATARGAVPVEDLRIGDLVHTLHAGMQPIKWIGTRAYASPFCNHAKILPIRIAAGALGDGVPARDLLVSPGHAMFVGGALIHAARLVNGTSITQLGRADSVTYYHVELASHEIILAENAPAETFRGEYFRAQFHNAENFSALYPGAQAPEFFSVPCLGDGFALDAIQRRRAGALTARLALGPLAGVIDQHTPSFISGWAADLAALDEPVILDILLRGRRLARVMANIARPDLAAAGYGAGHHGFECALPPHKPGAITIRRARDHQPLAFAAPSRRAA